MYQRNITPVTLTIVIGIMSKSAVNFVVITVNLVFTINCDSKWVD
jgi:hypothetical protein